MMKREFKSYFLLAICMLMLVAQVFPHHHHSEIFCLSTDLVAHGATEHAADICIIATMPTAIRVPVCVLPIFNAVHPTSICPT